MVDGDFTPRSNPMGKPIVAAIALVAAVTLTPPVARGAEAQPDFCGMVGCTAGPSLCALVYWEVTLNGVSINGVSVCYEGW
jgi:hypothetical protein